MSWFGSSKKTTQKQQEVAALKKEFPTIEWVSEDEFCISIITSNSPVRLRAVIPQQYPSKAPYIRLVNPASHSWADHDGALTECPAIRSWSGQNHVTLVALVQMIQERFAIEPPSTAGTYNPSNGPGSGAASPNRTSVYNPYAAAPSSNYPSNLPPPSTAPASNHYNSNSPYTNATTYNPYAAHNPAAAVPGTPVAASGTPAAAVFVPHRPSRSGLMPETQIDNGSYLPPTQPHQSTAQPNLDRSQTIGAATAASAAAAAAAAATTATPASPPANELGDIVLLSETCRRPQPVSSPQPPKIESPEIHGEPKLTAAQLHSLNKMPIEELCSYDPPSDLLTQQYVAAHPYLVEMQELLITTQSRIKQLNERKNELQTLNSSVHPEYVRLLKQIEKYDSQLKRLVAEYKQHLSKFTVTGFLGKLSEQMDAIDNQCDQLGDQFREQRSPSEVQVEEYLDAYRKKRIEWQTLNSVYQRIQSTYGQ